MFRLFLAERRPRVWSILQDVFNREEGVVLCREAPSTFIHRQDLDALVMPGWYAHERFGGVPIAGVAQIVSTRNRSTMPPWIVTTPPFAAHIVLDDTENAKVVRDDVTLSLERENFIVFARVFEAIEHFNASSLPQILRLGCALEVLRIPDMDASDADMKNEIAGIRSAYHERHPNLSKL